MLIVIWMAQLIVYPGFRYLDAESFKAWHTRYAYRIALFVVPLMTIQGAAIGLQILTDLRPAHLLSALFVIGAWGTTFGLSVPCHKRLQRNGKVRVVIDELVATNWIRTVLWTGVFLLGIWTHVYRHPY